MQHFFYLHVVDPQQDYQKCFIFKIVGTNWSLKKYNHGLIVNYDCVYA